MSGLLWPVWQKQLKHSSEYLLLCFTEERKSSRFRKDMKTSKRWQTLFTHKHPTCGQYGSDCEVYADLLSDISCVSVCFFLYTGPWEADCSFLDEYPLYVDQFITPQGKMLYIYMSTWCPGPFNRERRERESGRNGLDYKLAAFLILLRVSKCTSLPVLIKSSLTKPSIKCIINYM